MKREGEKIKSTALISTSEDSKADVLASFTALAGVIGGWSGLIYLDAIFGLIVSIFIFKTAFSIGKRNIKFLTGGAPPKKVVNQIKNVLDKRDKITSYHDLEAHYVGPEIHVSLSIHLLEELEFDKVHKIEEEIKNKSVR